MSDQNIEKVRQAARQIAERVKTDPGFKAQVEKDPKGTLTAAGLPEEAVGEFLREAQMTDVAGYSADLSVCAILSCIVFSF